MLTNECWRLEAHATGATLYFSGVACAVSMSRALDCCNGLAHSVTALRLDLTGAQSVTIDALRILRARLQEWRDGRGGSSRIERAESPRSHAALTQREPPIAAEACRFTLCTPYLPQLASCGSLDPSH